MTERLNSIKIFSALMGPTLPKAIRMQLRGTEFLKTKSVKAHDREHASKMTRADQHTHALSDFLVDDSVSVGDDTHENLLTNHRNSE